MTARIITQHLISFLLLWLTGNFVNGQADTMIIHIGNDSLKAVGKYENNLEQGLWTYFHFNGNKQSEGKYLKGKPFGEWTNWQEDGKILNKINYDDKGLKQGVFIEYLYRIPETHELYFVNDTLDGKVTYRHFDGHVIIAGNYRKGKRDGKWNWYYPSGKIQSEGDYLDDGNEGHWIYFFENGNKDNEGIYHKGKKDSEWVFYFENSDKVRAKGKYENDLREGKWITYNSEGKITKTEYYEKDTLKWTK